jgi:hypothetical protein
MFLTFEDSVVGMGEHVVSHIVMDEPWALLCIDAIINLFEKNSSHGDFYLWNVGVFCVAPFTRETQVNFQSI